jgi:hypothetical protein
MPVFCFDLGAQADALRASLDRGGTGAILALDIEVEKLHVAIKWTLSL